MHAYYKIRKDIHDKWFGNHDIYLVWWCDLLRHAEWKTKDVRIKNKTVTLHSGEQIASINDLVQRWKRGKDMIIKFIDLLRKEKLIEKRSSNNISIIRIVNSDNNTDNLIEDKTDNLKPVSNPYKQKVLNTLTSNKADNHADTKSIYKKERNETSTTTTRESINDLKEEGIEIGVAIERLLADKFQLLEIQRYTGISVNDITLWSVDYVERCDIQKGGYNSKGYHDVIAHFTDWLLSQKAKGKSPKPNLIKTEAQAKEIWNKVQAQLLLGSVIPEDTISSLVFDEYNPQSQSIGLIVPDTMTKSAMNNEYKTEIETVFSRYTQSKIKLRFGVIEQNNSITSLS